jgi:hypothetical protein
MRRQEVVREIGSLLRQPEPISVQSLKRLPLFSALSPPELVA